ncbi:MAG: ABC transporter permease [Gemmatimonadaceae bacterium]
MQQWTRAFATAELQPRSFAFEPLRALARRPLLPSLIARPAGRIALGLITLTLAAAFVLPLLPLVDPFLLVGAPLSAPSLAHPMGTDALGRDLFSGVINGARMSLFIAMAVTTLAFVCGAAVGLLAGYYGGAIDDALMRLTELFQVVPRFFLVALALALFGPGVNCLVLVLGLTSWTVLARVVRGEVLALRELDFIRASQSLGATDMHIVRRAMLPHVLPSAIVVVGLLFGQVLLIEASLGFVGLGDPNALSWGSLVARAQGFVRAAWWLPFFPGLAILVAVLAVNLLADALSEPSLVRGRA